MRIFAFPFPGRIRLTAVGTPQSKSTVPRHVLIPACIRDASPRGSAVDTDSDLFDGAD